MASRREPREPETREERLAIQIARALTRGKVHAVTLRLDRQGKLKADAQLPEWGDASDVEL